MGQTRYISPLAASVVFNLPKADLTSTSLNLHQINDLIPSITSLGALFYHSLGSSFLPLRCTLKSSILLFPNIFKPPLDKGLYLTSSHLNPPLPEPTKLGNLSSRAAVSLGTDSPVSLNIATYFPIAQTHSRPSFWLHAPSASPVSLSDLD